MSLNRVIIMQTKNNSSWATAFTGVRMWFNFGYLLWLKFVYAKGPKWVLAAVS